MSKRIIPASQHSFYDNYHFAPAVVDDDHLRCSGVIGVNMKDGSVASDPTVQFTQAFENLAEVLAAGGGSFSSIIEMTTFHVGLRDHLTAFMAVKDNYIKEPYPAWTAIGISELAIPGGLVEIRVTARLSN